jgi:hypothetical protein
MIDNYIPPEKHYPVHVVREYNDLSTADKFIIASLLRGSISRLLVIDEKIRLLFKTNPGCPVDYRSYRYLMREAMKACKVLIRHEDLGRKMYPTFYESEYFVNLYEKIKIDKTLKEVKVSMTQEALDMYYKLLQSMYGVSDGKEGDNT